MKNSNIFNIGTKLFGLLFMMAILAAFNTLAAAGGAVIYGVGAVVIGEPVTVDNVKAGSADLDRDYVSKLVTQMRPAATPLDTILRQIGNQTSIKSFRSDYYAVDSRPLYDTVHAAYTNAGDGAVTANLAVHNISMWAADDTCMMKGVTGVDGKDLVCYVIARNVGSSYITVQPLNGLAGTGTTAGKMILPTIPIDTRVVRLGACKHELDAQTTPYGIIPVKDYNYMQIFMAQVEESTFQRIHEKEVDWNFSDYEAQNIYDMRATMEYSFLFGVRSLLTSEGDGKDRYSTGGITRFITNGLEYGTGGTDRTIDNATFVDWTKSIFTGNSGADTRILFGGDGLMANLTKVDTIIKQLEAKQTEVKWGLTFKAIETNFGKLLFKHHPLLDLAGWGDNGIVLDMNHIEKHTFKPMATRKLSLKESGQRNVDAVIIEETTGVIVRYPATHSIIAPKA
jgi:hypothetical protein